VTQALNLVPTLCVGTHVGTLRVERRPVGCDLARKKSRDAERPGLRSHAERGNEVRVAHFPTGAKSSTASRRRSFCGKK
jgi:hypothetical protein